MDVQVNLLEQVDGSTELQNKKVSVPKECLSRSRATVWAPKLPYFSCVNSKRSCDCRSQKFPDLQMHKRRHLHRLSTPEYD